MSVIMFAANVINVIATITPWITGKSRLLVAVTKSAPTPGQLNTVSVIGAPANNPPKYRPIYVVIGINAFLKPCR